MLHGDLDWARRQREMVDWYSRLIRDRPDEATDMYLSDMSPHDEFLATCSGVVADIGGGTGVVREYLPSSARYVSIDPSTSWLTDDWSSLRDVLGSLAQRPPFVSGVGEAIPLRSESCDVVLAFWSVNHMSDPMLFVDEARRVLRTGGRLLMVLEDMEPAWRDVFTARSIPRRASARKKASLALAGGRWPHASDHIAVSEREVRRRCRRAGFELRRREWTAGYLSLEMRSDRARPSPT